MSLRKKNATSELFRLLFGLLKDTKIVLYPTPATYRVILIT
jgi:hypothetical protein